MGSFKDQVYYVLPKAIIAKECNCEKKLLENSSRISKFYQTVLESIDLFTPEEFEWKLTKIGVNSS